MSGAWQDGLTGEQQAALDLTHERLENGGNLRDASLALRAAFGRKAREREAWVHPDAFDGRLGDYPLAGRRPGPEWVKVRITEVLP